MKQVKWTGAAKGRVAAAAAAVALAGCNGGGAAFLNAHPAPPPPVEVSNMAFTFQQLPSPLVAGTYAVSIGLANGNGGIGQGTALAQPLNLYAVPTGSLSFGTTAGTATSSTMTFTNAITQVYVSFAPPAPVQPPEIYATTIDAHGRTVQIVLPFFGQTGAISTTLSSTQRKEP
jgi:hypothetical protein